MAIFQHSSVVPNINLPNHYNVYIIHHNVPVTLHCSGIIKLFPKTFTDFSKFTESRQNPKRSMVTRESPNLTIDVVVRKIFPLDLLSIVCCLFNVVSHNRYIYLETVMDMHFLRLPLVMYLLPDRKYLMYLLLDR